MVVAKMDAGHCRAFHFPCPAARTASGRFVLETFLNIEFLLARGEGELSAALPACEDSVRCHLPLSSWLLWDPQQ